MGWKRCLFVPVLVAAVLFPVYDNYVRCNHSHIRQLCTGFKDGIYSGPLCNDLCVEKNVTFDKCTTMNYIKLVHEGTVQGRNVVLKLLPQWFMDFDAKKHLHDLHQQLPLQYENLILNEIRYKFGNGTQSKELANTFIAMADVDQDGHLTKAEGDSMLALLTQQEPTMLIALNGSKHTIGFRGYCGGLYAVDKVTFLAGDFFGVWRMEDFLLLLAWFDPLKDAMTDILLYLQEVFEKQPRINDALNIFISSLKRLAHVRAPPTLEEMFLYLFQHMDMILELSSKPYGIVYSCDVQNWNYGFTENFTIKAIDLDLTFTEPLLQSILSQKSCLAHQDCKAGSHGQCMSRCDFDTGFCLPQPHTPQDLQFFCMYLADLTLGVPDFAGISPGTVDCLDRGITSTADMCLKLPRANSSHVLAVNVNAVKTSLEKVKEHCMNKPF